MPLLLPQMELELLDVTASDHVPVPSGVRNQFLLPLLPHAMPYSDVNVVSIAEQVSKVVPGVYELLWLPMRRTSTISLLPLDAS